MIVLGEHYMHGLTSAWVPEGCQLHQAECASIHVHWHTVCFSDALQGQVGLGWC